MKQQNANLSGHILPTSATMVGVCMTVISIIKLTKAGGHMTGVSDQVLAFDSVLFLASVLFSYLSIRAVKEVADRLERIADVAFLFGLVFMVVASFLLVYEIA